MEHETPQSVSLWAEATFGPVGSNFFVACRANREMAELLTLAAAGDFGPKFGEECADVVIVLFRLADRNGIGLKWGPMYWDWGNLEAASYLNSGLAELIRLLGHDDRHIRLETDVQWIVCRAWELARRNGIDLQAEIDRKMICNRSRTWALDGNGHGEGQAKNDATG